MNTPIRFPPTPSGSTEEYLVNRVVAAVWVARTFNCSILDVLGDWAPSHLDNYISKAEQAGLLAQSTTTG